MTALAMTRYVRRVPPADDVKSMVIYLDQQLKDIQNVMDSMIAAIKQLQVKVAP